MRFFCSLSTCLSPCVRTSPFVCLRLSVHLRLVFSVYPSPSLRLSVTVCLRVTVYLSVSFPSVCLHLIYCLSRVCVCPSFRLSVFLSLCHTQTDVSRDGIPNFVNLYCANVQCAVVAPLFSPLLRRFSIVPRTFSTAESSAEELGPWTTTTSGSRRGNGAFQVALMRCSI